MGRVARYATSTKNITGCVLAIGGPALAVFGVISPPLGLALAPALYAIGAVAAPARKPVHLVAGIDASDVERSLGEIERRIAGRVPVPRCAAHHVVSDGKTARRLLTEQLALLDRQINEIAEAVNRADTDKLLANGRFLAEKFARGPLDIDGAGETRSAERPELEAPRPSPPDVPLQGTEYRLPPVPVPPPPPLPPPLEVPPHNPPPGALPPHPDPGRRSSGADSPD